jgi:pimeloyl-CoA synthetase
MDLVPSPIGPDENAPLRLPTRVGNKASSNVTLVKRGAQYNKVVEASHEEMTSKSKKSRITSSPENIIQDVSKHHDRVSCTLESLPDNIMNKNKTSPDEMALKVEKFTFHKDIISKKMEIETNHFSLENKKANQEHLHAKLHVVDERIAKNKSDMKEYKDTEELELYEIAKKNLLESMKLKGDLEMELFKS